MARGWPLLLLSGGDPSEPPTYASVAPILEERCVICHSGEDAPRGLELDGYGKILKGSRNGPVVSAGDPDASELVRRIRGESRPRMPLDGPPYLAPEEIALIEAWVAGGLRPPAPEKEEKPAFAPEPRRPEGVTYTDIESIVKRRCVKCHTVDGIRGAPPEGLRLDSWEGIVLSSERARVIPGNPEASELIRRIRGQARPRMPLDGVLSEDEIRLLTDWIAQGARNENGERAPVPSGARVRLHGVLTARWALDGLLLEVSGSTRIDKSPGAGDYVRVEGSVRPDGGIRANRIRRRSGRDDD